MENNITINKPIVNIINKNNNTNKESNDTIINNIFRESRNKIVSKIEAAKYIIKLIGKQLNNDTGKQIYDIVNNTKKIYEIDIITRLLCIIYHQKVDIDIELIKQKIHDEKQMHKILKNENLTSWIEKIINPKQPTP